MEGVLARRPEKSEALANFLVDAFTDLQLRSLLRRAAAHLDDLSAELPGPLASLRELAAASVATLQRHGLIDTNFFQCLELERPGRRSEIHALRQLWESFDQSSSPKGSWSISIRATLSDLNSADLQRILDLLKQISGDASLKIEHVGVGSVILRLAGSYLGFSAARSILREYLSSEIAGYVVFDLEWLNTDDVAPPVRRGYRIRLRTPTWHTLDNHTSVVDSVTIDVRPRHILPEPEMMALLRARLIDAQWRQSADGTLSYQFGDVLATLAADGRTITLSASASRSVTTRGLNEADAKIRHDEALSRATNDLRIAIGSKLAAAQGVVTSSVKDALEKAYSDARRRKGKAASVGEQEDSHETEEPDETKSKPKMRR